MKRAGRLMTIACALIAWAAATAADHGAYKANLIHNGGFERLSDGGPEGWFGRAIGVSAEAAHDGQYGLVLEPGASAAAFGVATIGTLKYDISGWVSPGGNSLCGIRADFFSRDGRLVESRPVPLDDAVGGWQCSKQRVEVPLGAGCLVLTAYNDGETNVFVDDIACHEVYQARLRQTSSPPSIDGCLDDACWENASVGHEPWMTTNGTVARQQTAVFACYDDDHLYIAFRLFTRDPDRLKIQETRDDFYVWRDDSAEVFIDPNHDHAGYCELEVSAGNVEYDAWALDKDWECIWEHAVGREHDAWTCEMAIDLASFEYRDARGIPTGRMMLPRPDVWGIAFCRNDYVSHESSSWSDTGDDFHNAFAYGHLLGFRPLRGAEYAAQTGHRVRVLREALMGWKLDLPSGAECAGAAVADVDTGAAGPIGLLGDLSSELDAIEDAAAAAEEYDDWIHVGQALDELGGGFAVLGELLQPALARRAWQERLGQPVALGVSLSRQPVIEDGPPAIWRLDDGLCVTMGRDDVSGVGVSVDAYADARAVRVMVDVPGLCYDSAAVVSAPALDEHKSEQWPHSGLDLSAGSRALLWAPLHSEASAAARVYPGTITVTAEGHPPLAQKFSVKVLDITVPRSGALGLSVLRPTFAARDITSELAGFGVIDGSAAVGCVPLPSDGHRYTAEEVTGITATLAQQWARSVAARPEMRRYVLGLVDTKTVEPEALARLYRALHRAVPGMCIMQLVTEPTAESMRPIDRWVDIWAAPGTRWPALRALANSHDQCWLYFELPGDVLTRGLGEARVQPWLARHLGADGIVWGASPEPEGSDTGMGPISLPVFEMCCRLLAIGHRDCDYFYHLQQTLIGERLRAKTGHHWRLTAEARMASRLYPTAVISPQWYTADYLSLLAQRERCQEVILRAERHLRPCESR